MKPSVFDGVTWDAEIVVPCVPKSVNTYTRHCVIQGRIRRFKHKDALTFEEIGAACIRGQRVAAKAYSVRIDIYLGKRQGGDLDNYAKQPLDLLVKHGVIHSDAAITELHMTKQRDSENPRTEIFVRGL